MVQARGDEKRSSKSKHQGKVERSSSSRRKLRENAPDSSSARERGDVRHRAALWYKHEETKNVAPKANIKAKSNGLPPHVESYEKMRPIVALRVSVETLDIARPCGTRTRRRKT